MRHDYDAIALGGGAAGLGVSGIAANLGAKTMMVEAERLGGDCTWTGCIPSKSLLKTARVAQYFRDANRYGLKSKEPEMIFSDVMEKVDCVREEVYKDADAPEIFQEMGVDVRFGYGRFVDRNTVEIEQSDGRMERVTGKYIFICTGSSAFIPPIPGLDGIEFLTNETLFELKRLPSRLGIIGAGPIGMEMAQAFSRLGSTVTIFEMLDRPLGKDHRELSIQLQGILANEGVSFHLSTRVTKVSKDHSGEIRVHSQNPDGEKELLVDALLVATGRRPNVKGLGLEKAGVRFDKTGIQVNRSCRTSVRNIYASGDVIGGLPFTHMAEQTSKVAVSRALLKLPFKVDQDSIPWITFTDPELAHLGMTKNELDDTGVRYETYRFPYSKIDRAIADRKSEGWIIVYAKRRSGKILGVDILGERAGDLIGEFALAKRNGITLRRFSDTIHPYPTYSLGARRAADQWYIKAQTERQVKWIKRLFGYRGQIPDLSDPTRIV